MFTVNFPFRPGSGGNSLLQYSNRLKEKVIRQDWSITRPYVDTELQRIASAEYVDRHVRWINYDSIFLKAIPLYFLRRQM